MAKNVTEAEFESLLKLYRETDQHEEKTRILRSLGAVKQQPLIHRVFDFAVSEEVRHQDLIFVLFGASTSSVGRQYVWTFLQEKSKVMMEHQSGSLLSYSVRCGHLV